MSFVTQQISLPGSDGMKHQHAFRLCNKCQKEVPPEGGVQMSQTRWVCAACWTRRAVRTVRNTA